MRLLLDVWHVILQRYTTFARLLGTLPTSIYTLYKHRIVIEVLPVLRHGMLAAAAQPIPPHRMMRVALKQFTVCKDK